MRNYHRGLNLHAEIPVLFAVWSSNGLPSSESFKYEAKMRNSGRDIKSGPSAEAQRNGVFLTGLFVAGAIVVAVFLIETADFANQAHVVGELVLPAGDQRQHPRFVGIVGNVIRRAPRSERG